MLTLTTYKEYPNSPEVTTWNYDPQRGFMTSKVYADGKGTAYTYNEDGQILSRVWARGITTAYSYDILGRLAGVDYSDGTPDITYVRDNIGRPTRITDATGVQTLAYNNDSSLASASVPYILNHNISYTYDNLGRSSTMQLKYRCQYKSNTGASINNSLYYKEL